MKKALISRLYQPNAPPRISHCESEVKGIVRLLQSTAQTTGKKKPARSTRCQKTGSRELSVSTGSSFGSICPRHAKRLPVFRYDAFGRSVATGALISPGEYPSAW